MIHDAKLIALKQEKRRLRNELDIAAGQITAIEKEVEKKREDADSVGRRSISVEMATEEVLLVQEILRAVAAEQAMLRVELRSPSRVIPSLAEVPESSD